MSPSCLTTDGSSPQMLPPFYLSGPTFSVRTPSPHGSPFTPAITGYEDSTLSRRLVDLCTILASSDPRYSSSSHSCGPVGSQGEFGEKFSDAFSEHYLHWCDTRYSRYEGLPVAPAAARHPPPPFPLLRGQSAALQSLSLPVGQVDSRVNPLPPLVLSDGGNLPSVTWDLVRREKIPQD